MNWQSVKFWQRSLGVERVILSRELSIHEITEIKNQVPEMELEAFIHGSICIAYSGRCLLSSYMDKRDANQGVCDNSCREKYKIHEKEMYIEDDINNPGKLYQVDEDQHGTYILNAKDLCMIEHLEALVKAGVISFKVEGRTKSEFYAAMVARSYRGALNDVLAGCPFNPQWMEELNKLSNRGYHTAFMLGAPEAQGQNYETSNQYNEKIKFLGLVKEGSESDLLNVEVKNKIEPQQQIQIISPNGASETLTVQQILTADGLEKSSVHSGSGTFKIKFNKPVGFKKNSILLSYV